MFLCDGLKMEILFTNFTGNALTVKNGTKRKATLRWITSQKSVESRRLMVIGMR